MANSMEARGQDRSYATVGRLLAVVLLLLGAPQAFAETNLIWSCTSATLGSSVDSCAGTWSWQRGENGKIVASAVVYGSYSTGTWRLWESIPQSEYVYACSANLSVGAPEGCPSPGLYTDEDYVLKSSIAPPPVASVRIGTAALVSPTTANTSFPAGQDSIHTNSLGTTGRPNEIVELARALRSDPDLIYDFVRNNIDTVWMYGQQKGALGAIIDKSGTPFDQAHLMVELLRQAGYSTAAYQVGAITLDASQFQTWTGISSAAAACQLLSSGGIPATVNGSTDVTNCTSLAGNVSTVTLAHVWVSVSIGGGPYLFDPSYKPYDYKAGVNLPSVAGLTTGQPMTQVATGMTSGTASGVAYSVNLGAQALNTTLQGYATNLLSYTQTVELRGDEVKFRAGAKFESIRAQASHAALCQRLLAHARTTQPATVRAVLLKSNGSTLGSCTQSSYRAGS